MLVRLLNYLAVYAAAYTPTYISERTPLYIKLWRQEFPYTCGVQVHIQTHVYNIKYVHNQAEVCCQVSTCKSPHVCANSSIRRDRHTFVTPHCSTPIDLLRARFDELPTFINTRLDILFCFVWSWYYRWRYKIHMCI